MVRDKSGENLANSIHFSLGGLQLTHVFFQLVPLTLVPTSRRRFKLSRTLATRMTWTLWRPLELMSTQLSAAMEVVETEAMVMETLRTVRTHSKGRTARTHSRAKMATTRTAIKLAVN